jgi:hypothetical protein
MFSYTLAKPPRAYPPSIILVYQYMIQKHTFMAVRRENCMVPSTLSPELPQRTVSHVGGLKWRLKPQSMLVVSMLASGTQVRMFKPGRIFQATKSSACLPSEGK